MAEAAPTPRAVQAGDHVFLVDGSSFVYRAYFQSMNQDMKYNYRSDGLPTGAIRLFGTATWVKSSGSCWMTSVSALTKAR